MSTSVICILLTIGVYLIGMLVVGFRFAKKNESAADFIWRQKAGAAGDSHECRGI